MSQSRQELIAQFDIQEPGLKALLDALCKKEFCPMNLGIIERALKGVYSEQGAEEYGQYDMYAETRDDVYIPQEYLIYDLNFLYPDMIAAAKADEYTYVAAPAPSDKHPDREAAQKVRDNQMSSYSSLFRLFTVAAIEYKESEKAKKLEERESAMKGLFFGK